MTTKAQMGQILGVLGVVYRRQALTTQELKLAVPVWHELLGDLDFDLLKAALHAHCATSKWFPSVAELRQAAHELIATDAEQVTAGEAWREVKRAIRLGQHRFQDGQARWSSPLVEAAYEALGGWSYFRTALEDNEMADRAHFTRAFEQLQRRQVDHARMHPAVRRFRQEYIDSAPQLPAASPGPNQEIPEQLGRLADQLGLGRPRESAPEEAERSRVFLRQSRAPGRQTPGPEPKDPVLRATDQLSANQLGGSAPEETACEPSTGTVGVIHEPSLPKK